MLHIRIFDDEELIGEAELEDCSDWQSNACRKVLRLVKIEVVEKRRREGVGASLLAAAMKYVNHNYDFLFGSTAGGSRGNRHFYRACGFKFPNNDRWPWMFLQEAAGCTVQEETLDELQAGASRLWTEAHEDK